MPTVVTNHFKFQEGGENISLSGDTWICSLMGTYVSASSIDTLKDIENWSEVSAYEASGTGYVSGTDLTNLSWYNDDTNNIQRLSADSVTFSTITILSNGVCIWRLSDGLVMGFIDYGSNSSSNGNFTVNWNSGGILIKI